MEEAQPSYSGFHKRGSPRIMANQYVYKIFYKNDCWDKYGTRSRYVPASYFEEDGLDYLFYWEDFGASKDNCPQIDNYLIHRVTISDVEKITFRDYYGEIKDPVEKDLRKSFWQKLFS